jgi:crotonobetainyl-CoA:carnitine CoA-transferase CaiB-like acyl-CoA transferase
MTDRPVDAPGALAGLRVIDLTQALAGPYCTMMLADLGADVIKVEPPGGDMTRAARPFTGEETERAYGGYFASVNRGKRSIVLDLKQPDDREVLLGLVDTADALVENSRAGVMDRLGVGYEALAERNPRLVYAAIRGFGDPRTGASPYVDWPAYDVIAQAMGGLVSITGLADGTVVKCGPSIGDLYGGAVAAIGLVSALLHAARTGEGQFVDVAMYDAVLSLCENAVAQYSYTGEVPGPVGNGHPSIPAFDVLPTADGNCAIATTNDATFRAACDALGAASMAEDPRFATFGGRLANRPALNEALSALTSTRTTAEVVEALGGRVPVGPVNDMAAIFRDPHVAARDMLVTFEQPDGSRPVTLAGQPIKMTRCSTRPRRRPPRLDEDRAAIVAELGTATA